MEKIIIEKPEGTNKQKLIEILRQDYILVPCCSGEEISRVIKQDPQISALILDFCIPRERKSLPELLENIPEYSNIAVIAEISPDDSQSEINALQWGIMNRIHPPYHPGILLPSVQMAVRQAREHARLYSRFEDAKRWIKSTFDNVECGISVMQVMPDGRLGVTYVNDGFCRMLNAEEEELLSMSAEDAAGVIHPDDRERVMEIYWRSMQKKESSISETFRIRKKDSYIWTNAKVKFLKNKNGGNIYYSIFLDVTKEKEAQEKMLMRDAAVSIAVEQTGMVFWTLDLTNHKVIYNESTEHGAGGININKWERSDIIYPGDREYVISYFKKIFAGEEAKPIEARLRKENSGEYYWSRITHTFFFDGNKKPVKAVGSSIDITKRKRLEDAFDGQMSFRNIVEQNVSSYCRLNLSKNQCGERQAPGYSYLEQLECGSVDDFFHALYLLIPDMEQRREYQGLFCCSNMKNSFLKGKSHIKYEHKSTANPEKTEWIETHANIMQNPETGDIEALLYTFNIDEAKTTQMLFEQVVNTEYDYLSTIDMQHDIYRMYSHNNRATSIPAALGTFSDIRNRHAQTLISPDTRKEYLKQLDYENIKENLKKKELHSFVFETIEADGSVRTRKMQLSYMDRDAQILCATRRDISDILEEEQSKAGILRDALQAAKQASTAKSDFLSRMSHEIRTPMNAIIGMTAIASDSIGDDAQVQECLKKIGVSSQFLLTLINDILDMSRIESGKVLLKNEKILFAEFINRIHSICTAQAIGKGVEYENIMELQPDEYYIGDFMKLQQILINILTNAIKFTPTGGKVTFSVREKRRMRKNAVLEFKVKDTGCGMSETFLPRLFEPFAQEHSGSTTSYGGTGLGLAICKNFVDLMDGHIRVNSRQGSGTEFTVDVKLGLTKDAKLPKTGEGMGQFSNLDTLDQEESQEAGDAEEEVDFTGKRVLLAEDHPMNAEIAKILLERRGMLVDHAQNGQIAVEMFANAKPGYYNVILMDVRMPFMDGRQATEKIRAFPRADAKSIPILAMTADAFEDDVNKCRQAGMNAHLSKPISPETLFDALRHFMR